MTLTVAWTTLEWRRRRRATVLTAIGGARRGATAISRLEARTLPATVTALPNQPGFDWAPVRALPEVAAVSTFAVAGYQIDGYPLGSQNVGFPPGDDNLMRTIERPVLLAGRVFDPTGCMRSWSAACSRATTQGRGRLADHSAADGRAGRDRLGPLVRPGQGAQDQGQSRGRGPVAVAGGLGRLARRGPGDGGDAEALPGQLPGPGQGTGYGPVSSTR
ncbi:MAG: hypothetical protein ACR2FU_02880 [Streptosporangiaceae bacterium]